MTSELPAAPELAVHALADRALAKAAGHGAAIVGACVLVVVADSEGATTYSSTYLDADLAHRGDTIAVGIESEMLKIAAFLRERAENSGALQ